MRQKWIWWALPLVLLGAFVLWQMGDDGAPRMAPESQEEHEAESPDGRPVALLDVTGLEGNPSTGPETSEGGADSPTDGSTRFHGLVVDEEQSPVAGARVEIRRDERVVRAPTTDADGVYEFWLEDGERSEEGFALAIARTDDGRAGWTVFTPRPRDGSADTADVKIRTFRLKPTHSVAVRVLSECPGGLPATLWVRSATWTSAAVLLKAKTDENGDATLTGVPAGQWLVYAAAKGCGQAWSMFATPRPTEEPVTLTLPVAHTLTVRVLEMGPETPIPGATVRSEQQLRLPGHVSRGPLTTVPSRYETDESGTVRITGLGGTAKYHVRATADGYPEGGGRRRWRGGPGLALVEPGQAEATIHLSRPLTIRWTLEDEGLGIPPEGTTITLKPWTNTGRLTVPPTGIVENGKLVVSGWSTDGASGYALWGNKGIARLRAQPGKTEGYPTGFFPLRTITLEARYADGTPVVGWYLVVRDGGNNPVGPSVKTDENGRAVMSGLYGGDRFGVEVSLQEFDSFGGHVQRLGTVKLIEKDGVFEAVVPNARTLHIRLEARTGEVPADRIGGTRIDYRLVKPEAAEGDPTLLIATVRPRTPDAETHVSIMVGGWVARPQKIRLADHPDPAELTFVLEPTASVNVRILEPEDKRHNVKLQRWNEQSKRWYAGRSYDDPSVTVDRAPFEGGIQPFRYMAPGRYRAVDSYSRATSEELEVRDGKTVDVTLDLRKAGYVRGTVIVPEGTPLTGLKVAPEGTAPPNRMTVELDPGLKPPIARVDPKTGAFAYRVPGTKGITLRVYHRTLRPHPTRGFATVRVPREGVDLAAVAGGIATVRLSKPPRIQLNPGRPRPVAVRLYKDEVKGKGQLLSGMLDAKHTTVTFGGYQPGTWTIWIDIPAAMPVVLEDQSLGEGDADLGLVDLHPGSRLRLDIKAKKGASPPGLTVFAQKLGEPTYTRRLDSMGDEATLEGIGPGRFRIMALAQGGGVDALIEEIEFDGESEVVRTFDAR